MCDTKTHKCVECVQDANCTKDTRTGYTDSSTYADRQFLLCGGDQKCLECSVNYGEQNGVPCPSEEKPLCDKGKCLPCPHGRHWDHDQKRCVCDTGVETPEGACVFCYDDNVGPATDTGCEQMAAMAESKPICWGPNDNNGSGASGTTCIQCVIDSDCAGDQHCDTDSHTCKTCDAGKMWDPNDRRCVPCFDDNTGAFQDKGCPMAGTPQDRLLCKPFEGGNTGAGQGGVDENCWLCYNNKVDVNQRQGDPDDGCSDIKPLCQADQNTYGNDCKVCKNTKDKDEIDAGCWDESPLCNGSRQGDYGTQCCVCQDTESGKSTDLGCGGSGIWKDKPLCAVGQNNASGAYGDSCAKCINDHESDIEKDTGCDDDAANRCNAAFGQYGHSCVGQECPIKDENGNCVTCKDTQKVLNQDAGCDEAARPLCVTPNYENNATQHAGDKCVTCVDTRTGTTSDFGCGITGTKTAGKPICLTANKDNNATKNEGTKCVECLKNSDCPKGSKCENYQCKTTCASPKCTLPDGTCIDPSTYVDLKRGANGACACYDRTESEHVSDQGNSCKIKDWDKEDSRRTSTRQRYYKVPSNPGKFYCAYYFEADGTADDFVVASQSDGIGAKSGKNGTHDSWKEARDNSIKPIRATHTVQGDNQQKKLVVQDRWLREVGYKGRFRFVLASAKGANGTVGHNGTKKKKVSVANGWNNVGGECEKIGGWRKKE